MKRTKGNPPNPPSLATQMKRRVHAPPEIKKTFEYDGDDSLMISTGSTLLDLAIAGGRVRGGGIPGGTIVEVFGPPSIGKTTLICEVAGNVQRSPNVGQVKFYDPEARLSSTYAKVCGFEVTEDEIEHPNTPLDIFPQIREWNPKNPNVINGVFIDSTAAIISDLELEDKKDEYSRRAKLFSQELRKSCRIITDKNLLIMTSNQLRQKVNTSGFGETHDTPGGEAWKFYASLRLKATKANPWKIPKEIKFRGQEIKKVIGTAINVYVYKSSVWIGHNSATVYLMNDYAIDDIRANLMYLKKYGPKIKVTGIKNGKEVTKDYSGYSLNGQKLAPGIDDAIDLIEQDGLVSELKETVIDLWEEIQSNFKVTRRKER